MEIVVAENETRGRVYSDAYQRDHDAKGYEEYAVHLVDEVLSEKAGVSGVVTSIRNLVFFEKITPECGQELLKKIEGKLDGTNAGLIFN